MLDGTSATEPKVYAVFVITTNGNEGEKWELNSLHGTKVGANTRMAERQAEPISRTSGFRFKVEPVDVED